MDYELVSNHHKSVWKYSYSAYFLSYRDNTINSAGPLLDLGYFMSSLKPIILLQKRAGDPYCASVHQLKRLHQSNTLIIRMEVTSLAALLKNSPLNFQFTECQPVFSSHINTVLEFVLYCPVWLWARRPEHTYSSAPYGPPLNLTLKQNLWWQEVPP